MRVPNSMTSKELWSSLLLETEPRRRSLRIRRALCQIEAETLSIRELWCELLLRLLLCRRILSLNPCTKQLLSLVTTLKSRACQCTCQDQGKQGLWSRFPHNGFFTRRCSFRSPSLDASRCRLPKLRVADTLIHHRLAEIMLSRQAEACIVVCPGTYINFRVKSPM